MARSFSFSDDYREKLKSRICNKFVNNINPGCVLVYFHKYNYDVLCDRDMQEVEAKTSSEGNQAGAKKLLDCLVVYNGWFPCLLKVLRDPDVKLGHVADSLQQFEEQLNAEIKLQSDQLGLKIEVLESENKKKDETISHLQHEVQTLKAEMQNRTETKQVYKMEVSDSVGCDGGMDVSDSAERRLSTQQHEHQSENLKLELEKMAEHIERQTSEITRLQNLLGERAKENEGLRTENEAKDQQLLIIQRELKERTREVGTLKRQYEAKDQQLLKFQKELEESRRELEERTREVGALKITYDEGLSQGHKLRCHQGAAGDAQDSVSLPSERSQRHPQSPQLKHRLDVHVTDLEYTAKSKSTLIAECVVEEIQSAIEGKVYFRDNGSENYLYASLHFKGHPQNLKIPTGRSWKSLKVTTTVVDRSQRQLVKEQIKTWEDIVGGYKEKWGYGVGGIGCDKIMKKGFGKKKIGNERGEMLVRMEIEFL